MALSDAPLLRALAGDRPLTPRCGSCGRPAGRFPSIATCASGPGCSTPASPPISAAEITLQPVRRHGVDAAVFFSDIVIPLRLAGVEVEIEPGRGPVFANPVRTAADVDRITAIDPDDLDGTAIAEAVRLVTAELGDTPLIGFAGAPFTLAAYLVEGGPSKEHLRARAMMHSDPDSWNRLAGWLAQVSRRFPRDAARRRSIRRPALRQLGRIPQHPPTTAPSSPRIPYAALSGIGLPTIHFGVGTGPFLADMRLDGVADGVGVDWRQPLDEAAAILGPDVTVQGNIDPALLSAPWPVLEAHVRDVVEPRPRSARAHILNLGHGVPPGGRPRPAHPHRRAGAHDLTVRPRAESYLAKVLYCNHD